MDRGRARDRDEEARLLTQPAFTGVAVALVTLFHDDLTVDYMATSAHAAQLVELGVSAVVVSGSTGEAAALDVDERTSIIKAARGDLGDAIPLIAGTGAPSARQAAEFTARAADAGADAVLALSPPFASDPRPYYDSVSEAADGLPVLAYHYPDVSAPGIALDALADLPVVGLKDSSGDAGRLLAELEGWDRPVYPGSSALTALAGLVGCPGVILALANADPENCVAAFTGDGAAQRRLSAGQEAMRAGGFRAGVKDLTARRFGTSTASRMG